MSDHLTPEQRSRAMRQVKLKDGSLERLVQQELRAHGLHFKRHLKTLPGRPDIVFPKEKLAIFVDGDFWHGWRLPVWEHKLSPFWREKLNTNRARDQRNFRRLRGQGWQVIRIWQHQARKDIEACTQRILKALGHTSKRKKTDLPKLVSGKK